MKQFEITDFASLHNIISKYRLVKEWIFRGQANIEWALLPKIGRDEYSWVDEWKLFEVWKRRATAYVSMHLNTEWDWLSIAQHHGLATKFLDWTSNPLNAAYFALREENESDSVIYAVRIDRIIIPEKMDPKKCNGVRIFRPRAVVPRIVRQNGLFTFHSDPRTPLESNKSDLLEIHKLVIRKKFKHKLLSELAFYGIHGETLFPDLDGLSDFLNWTVKNREYSYLPNQLARRLNNEKKSNTNS